jgi:cell division protein FtsW
MNISRTDQSLFAQWWFTVDRVLLTAIFVLIGGGLVLSLAASPAMALKRGLPVFYFAQRHALFAVLSVGIIIAFSTLGPRHARRTCLVLLAAALAMMTAVLWIGPEINGARRWLRIAGYSFQPSELAKPAFIVVSAWLFAESQQRPNMPAIPMAIGLYIALASLLVLEPDIGQTLLVSIVWGALFFISGMPLTWAAGLLALGATALAGAYATFGHVRDRIDRFLNPASGDTYQMDRALQAIREGGLLGRGPGEGTVKTVLPDAHTDFIFAVIAEEYGAVTCLVVIGLFAFVAVRAFARALDAPDAFQRNALVGLTLLFAMQGAINMAVNSGLVPAKGMTLPFISYGGSSMLALAVTMGLLIGLARKPGPEFQMRGGAGVASVGHAERTAW